MGLQIHPPKLPSMYIKVYIIGTPPPLPSLPRLIVECFTGNGEVQATAGRLMEGCGFFLLLSLPGLPFSDGPMDGPNIQQEGNITVPPGEESVMSSGPGQTGEMAGPRDGVRQDTRCATPRHQEW